MVIDESTAKAAIKKNIKIYQRRLQNLCVQEKKYWKMSKSRQGWLKKIVNTVRRSRLVIDLIEVSLYTKLIIYLEPVAQKFNLQVMELDAKKFNLVVYSLDIILTNHFIIRMLQSRKTLNMDDLSGDLKKIVNVVMNVCGNKTIEISVADMGIYLDSLGYVALSLERNQENTMVCIKTVIPPQIMGQKHKFQYRAIEGSGYYKVVH